MYDFLYKINFNALISQLCDRCWRQKWCCVRKELMESLWELSLCREADLSSRRIRPFFWKERILLEVNHQCCLMSQRCGWVAFPLPWRRWSSALSSRLKSNCEDLGGGGGAAYWMFSFLAWSRWSGDLEALIWYLVARDTGINEIWYVIAIYGRFWSLSAQEPFLIGASPK